MGRLHALVAEGAELRPEVVVHDLQRRHAECEKMMRGAAGAEALPQKGIGSAGERGCSQVETGWLTKRTLGCFAATAATKADSGASSSAIVASVGLDRARAAARGGYELVYMWWRPKWGAGIWYFEMPPSPNTTSYLAYTTELYDQLASHYYVVYTEL